MRYIYIYMSYINLLLIQYLFVYCMCTNEIFLYIFFDTFFLLHFALLLFCAYNIHYILYVLIPMLLQYIVYSVLCGLYVYIYIINYID